MDALLTTVRGNGLVVAFAVVGLTVWVSNVIATKFTNGRIHGSAIAITLGLVAAYVGGRYTGGGAGVADVSLLAGIGIMGGGMFRDFAIVATAFGVNVSELKKAGTAGGISIVSGVLVSFVVAASEMARMNPAERISHEDVPSPTTTKPVLASQNISRVPSVAAKSPAADADELPTSKKPVPATVAPVVLTWKRPDLPSMNRDSRSC